MAGNIFSLCLGLPIIRITELMFLVTITILWTLKTIEPLKTSITASYPESGY